MRYQAHPGVRRRRAEAAAERSERLERLNRPHFVALKERVPSHVSLQMRSLDDLVDAGCAWEVCVLGW